MFSLAKSQLVCLPCAVQCLDSTQNILVHIRHSVIPIMSVDSPWKAQLRLLTVPMVSTLLAHAHILLILVVLSFPFHLAQTAHAPHLMFSFCFIWGLHSEFALEAWSECSRSSTAHEVFDHLPGFIIYWTIFQCGHESMQVDIKTEKARATARAGPDLSGPLSKILTSEPSNLYLPLSHSHTEHLHPLQSYIHLKSLLHLSV